MIAPRANGETSIKRKDGAGSPRTNSGRDPLCAQRLGQRWTTRAVPVHHIEVQDGDDRNKFWLGPIDRACFCCQQEMHVRGRAKPTG